VDDRTCPHCHESKPLDDFQVNRTNGYRYRACKACRRQRDNETQRDRYRNDPDYRRLKKSRSLAAYRKRTA
jgi:RNA polymerase subunit RPABC4/transcription elongation factor Spt4